MNAVDLDTATVTLCEEKRSKLTAKLLPKKAARQLRARLAALLERVRQHRRQARKLEATQDDGAIDFEFRMKRAEMQLDLDIREVFLHFMVSVLVCYVVNWTWIGSTVLPRERTKMWASGCVRALGQSEDEGS